MRELPPQDQLNKPHDAAHIIVLPPEGWYCVHPECVPVDLNGSVTWIRMADGTEFGRCSTCGQKYVLANNGEAA